MNNFENKVRFELQTAGIDFDSESLKNLKIGVAVSGGADSVSLLISLVNIFSPLNITVHVITINHFIRPDEETCGDAMFVRDLCNQLCNAGFFVEFSLVELQRGQTSKISQEENCGIEAAARELRYEAFEKFVFEKDLNFLCLAHNQNDNYETVLMRFIKGSSCDGLRGIMTQRSVFKKSNEAKYIRPLIKINRSEIENYLNEKKICWRTDLTNSDTNYLRNKIRLKLVPFLDENFENWRAGLDTQMIRAADDFSIIEEVENAAWNLVSIDKSKVDDCSDIVVCSISIKDFSNLNSALKKRILLRMCNRISDVSRISYWFLGDVCDALKNSENFVKVYENIEISVKKQRLFVKKHVKLQTDLCFSDIIYKKGIYHFPFGMLQICEENNSLSFVFSRGNQENYENSVIFYAKNLVLPVCVRNCRIGDELLCSDGKYKKLSDVYSDWQIEEGQRKYIPLVQELGSCEQKIVCVAAGLFGYKNWILKEFGETE